MAYSGGADSTALLYAVARWKLRHLPGQPLYAFHIHHGLQAAADGFEAHCRATCARLATAVDLRLDVLRVQARHAKGQSPEDAARRRRYEALSALAQRHGVGTVLLAQHADDQAETVLLALTRGAGLPGLAAMPEWQQRGGVAFARPLLGVPAAQLRAWLTQQGIAHVDDPSNRDERYARNRLRGVFTPALQAAFPAYREMFARSARHAAAAQQLLAELAEADLRAVQSSRRAGALSLQALQGLGAARRANVLRHWLQQQGTAATAAQLDELVAQIATGARHGAPRRLRLRIGAGSVRRTGDELEYSPQ